MEKDKNNYALIFAGFIVSDAERFRIAKEIEKIGGLSFKIKTSEEGWIAQCNEVDGIIAGSTNSKPTNTEIESEIRQAIISALNIKVQKPSVESPFKFEYEVSSKVE